MNQQDIEMKIENDYCTCGAKHGTSDGNYACTKDCLATQIKQALAEIRIADLEEVRKLQKELQEWKIGKFCSTHQSHNIVAYLDSKIKSLKK